MVTPPPHLSPVGAASVHLLRSRAMSVIPVHTEKTTLISVGASCIICGILISAHTEVSNEKPKIVVGHLMNDQLFVKSVTASKHFDWLKWLEAAELVAFFEELLKLVTQISEGKKDAGVLSIFLADWRETALINSEPDVLADIVEAEQELDAGGGKPWSQIKKEIGL